MNVVTTKQGDQTLGAKSSATDGVTVKFVKNRINDGTLSLSWRVVGGWWVVKVVVVVGGDC